jgi:hypothetical protein
MTWSLATVIVDDKIDDDKQMHLVRRLFRWPRRCARAIQMALPNSMSRATSEATGHRHQANTSSVLPQRPSGQQENKQQSTNRPKKLAMLMAAVVRRYDTARIA